MNAIHVCPVPSLALLRKGHEARRTALRAEIPSQAGERSALSQQHSALVEGISLSRIGNPPRRRLLEGAPTRDWDAARLPSADFF